MIASEKPVIGNDDEPVGEYASPACLMHEVDPAYFGLPTREDERMSLNEIEISAVSKALLTDLPDAVIYAEANSVIRYWNDGAERIFGFSAAEMLGNSMEAIIPERLRDRHNKGFDAMMETGKSSHAPDEILATPAMTKAGDTISIQFTVAPVKSQDGELTGVVAVLRDVTETFKEMRKLRAALKDAG